MVDCYVCFRMNPQCARQFDVLLVTIITIDCARQCYKLIDVEEILRINSSTPK